MKLLRRIFLSNIFCDESTRCWKRGWREAQHHHLLYAAVVLIAVAVVVWCLSWRLY